MACASRSIAFLLFAGTLLQLQAVEAKPAKHKANKLQRRLLSDNAYILRHNPAALHRKFKVKMKVSPFIYFRGTAMRFDHRLRKQDRGRPHVLSNGDVHPLNFGVMRVGARLRWAANDQDEAHRAPYTWDLKRGAVGFELMAAEHGLSRGKRQKILRAFVDSYLSSVKDLAHPGAGTTALSRRPPKLIRQLLVSARQAEANPGRFYAKYLNTNGSFRSRERYTPVPLSAGLRQAYGGYLSNLASDKPEAARQLAGYRVTGAAIKETNGVGSMGLKRYLLALQPRNGAGATVMLELKQQRAPALAHYVRGLSPTANHARRVYRARQLQTGGGERFDGHTSHGSVNYQVMTVGPHQLDVSDAGQARLGGKELRQLARACGAALAEAHVQSGRQRMLARQILVDARSTAHLDKQITRFAQQTAGKLVKEHKTFRWLLKRNAFGL
jgi:uncharacterized protein (DUF2252 family)